MLAYIFKSVGVFFIIIIFMQNDQVTSADFLHFEISWETYVLFQFLTYTSLSVLI